jgi:hypothetical protein
VADTKRPWIYISCDGAFFQLLDRPRDGSWLRDFLTVPEKRDLIWEVNDEEEMLIEPEMVYRLPDGAILFTRPHEVDRARIIPFPVDRLR